MPNDPQTPPVDYEQFEARAAAGELPRHPAWHEVRGTFDPSYNLFTLARVFPHIAGTGAARNYRVTVASDGVAENGIYDWQRRPLMSAPAAILLAEHLLEDVTKPFHQGKSANKLPTPQPNPRKS